MTAELRASIRAATDDAADPTAPIRALGYALAWAAGAVSRTLASPPAVPGSDAGGVELLLAIDDALKHVPDMVDQISLAVQSALAGTPVADYLNQRITALAVASESVQAARRDHDALRAVEAEIVNAQTEHDRLSARVAELRRFRKLADSLPELRQQHDQLTRRHDTLLAETEQAERALLATAGDVLVLDTDRLGLLETRTREALARLVECEARAVEEDRKFTDASRRRAEVEERLNGLKTLHSDTMSALRARADIDRDLLARLGRATDGNGLSEAQGQLAAAETLLDQVGDALSAAMRRHDGLNSENRGVIEW